MLIKIANVKLSDKRNFDEVLKFNADLTVEDYIALGFTGAYPKPKEEPKPPKPKKSDKPEITE